MKIQNYNIIRNAFTVKKYLENSVKYILVVFVFMLVAINSFSAPVELGPRPYFLIDKMTESPLKEKLQQCSNQTFESKLFSIGHRGAPLMFPEHTVESYTAAARMGAGIVECDVTFTADLQLVCRHAQNDLHTTTNILATRLANKCTKGFIPASGGEKASAECRASDIALAEFKTLIGKMDAANTNAKTVKEYTGGTANYRTELYTASTGGTLMTHAESIKLFRTLGVKFTPELKSPSVKMPFRGFSQEDYAQKLIDEYKAANIPPEDVWAQSFNLDDVLYWIKNEPKFGKQAVYLDNRYEKKGFDVNRPENLSPTMKELAKMNVRYIAPPMWALVTLKNGKIAPSGYARAAKEAGLNIITWTLERSGPLANGGGWYYQTITDITNNDGIAFELLDVLAKQVGIKGIFSDWPATVTYYANCMNLK